MQGTLDQGPRPVRELQKLAEEARIARATIKRARRELWIEERKVGIGGVYVWEPVRLEPDLMKDQSPSPRASHPENGWMGEVLTNRTCSTPAAARCAAPWTPRTPTR
jgi:hypothetical protein